VSGSAVKPRRSSSRPVETCLPVCGHITVTVPITKLPKHRCPLSHQTNVSPYHSRIKLAQVSIHSPPAQCAAEHPPRIRVLDLAMGAGSTRNDLGLFSLKAG
jgi:hypothetical protein